MSDRRALLLSGGQQKLVALARALAVGTRLLLLDEPFEGVAPALSMRLSDVIGKLKSTDLSVLIAQSDVNHANELLDAQVVIERGANQA
jgi:branched-chain amino acid transport system ATP-binding protein